MLRINSRPIPRILCNIRTSIVVRIAAIQLLPESAEAGRGRCRCRRRRWRSDGLVIVRRLGRHRCETVRRRRVGIRHTVVVTLVAVAQVRLTCAAQTLTPHNHPVTTELSDALPMLAHLSITWFTVDVKRGKSNHKSQHASATNRVNVNLNLKNNDAHERKKKPTSICCRRG